MKKLLLSIAVIIGFIFYSWYEKSRSKEYSNETVIPTTYIMPTKELIENNQGTRGPYKDGTYTGNTVDAYYGDVQVQALVEGGKITEVAFLKHPDKAGASLEINAKAVPLLTSEAIRVQSAQVDGVSGATATSKAFIESLTSALQQAQ